MLAVAHRVKDTHEDVVHDGENGAAEVESEINHRLGKNAFRCIHPPKNRRRESDAEHRQQDARSQAEGHIGVDGDAHFFMVLRTEETGDDHTGTHGHTVEKAHEHMDQTAGGADCSQGSIADETAHHPGVKGIVELLKNIAQKNGQGEKQDFFPDGTLGQRIRIGMQEKHFLCQKLQTQRSILLYSTRGEKSSDAHGIFGCIGAN